MDKDSNVGILKVWHDCIVYFHKDLNCNIEDGRETFYSKIGILREKTGSYKKYSFIAIVLLKEEKVELEHDKHCFAMRDEP